MLLFSALFFFLLFLCDDGDEVVLRVVARDRPRDLAREDSFQKDLVSELTGSRN